MNSINTGKVTDRRRLRFATIDDLLADVEKIVAADKAGTLRRTGNWTPGQALGHIATWATFPYEGFPKKAHPPWFIRWLIRMKKAKYLKEGMPAGVRIPGIEGGTLATEILSTEEGARRLRAVLQRLKNGEPAKHESPAFGPMSLDERIALNLRHAELHLSFLHP